MSDIDTLSRMLLAPNGAPNTNTPTPGYYLDRDSAIAQARQGYPYLFGQPQTLLQAAPQPILPRIQANLGPLSTLTGFDAAGNPSSNTAKVSPSSPIGAQQSAILAAAAAKVPSVLGANLSAQATGAGASAQLKNLQALGLTNIDASKFDWKPLQIAPQPDVDYPDVPTRPAPHASQLVAGLAAAAGALVPRAAGYLNAAPFNAALNVANLQYGDLNKQFEQETQQANMDYADKLRQHNEQMQIQALNNEAPFQRMLDLTKQREALAGITNEPTRQAAGASVLTDPSSGLPYIAQLERASDTAEGAEKAASMFPETILRSGAIGVNQFRAETARDLVDARLDNWEQGNNIKQQGADTRREIYGLPVTPDAPMPVPTAGIPIPSGISASQVPGQPLATRKAMQRQTAAANGQAFHATHTIGNTPVQAFQSPAGKTYYKSQAGVTVKPVRPAVPIAAQTPQL